MHVAFLETPALSASTRRQSPVGLSLSNAVFHKPWIRKRLVLVVVRTAKKSVLNRGIPFQRCNFVAQFGNKGMKGSRFRVAQSLESAFNVGDNVFGVP